MKLKIDVAELEQYGAREGVPCECLQCHNPFLVPKNVVLRGIKGTKAVDYCCRECSDIAHRTKLVPVICRSCKKEFQRKESRVQPDGNNFCSHRCRCVFFNATHKYPQKKVHLCRCGKAIRNCVQCHQCRLDQLQQAKVAAWKTGEETGYSGKTFHVKKFLRRHLFEKFEHKCAKCGWARQNPVTQTVPLEVNHIDGNPRNNQETNLELICPNCHALTTNFRNLNKHSPRNRKVVDYIIMPV